MLGQRPRQARRCSVSVLDSVVQGGDAVWEGLCVANGRIYQLNEHLERLVASAHALLFEGIPSIDYIKQSVFDTLAENGMTDGVHIRLTLTRGQKSTSGMPRLNVFGCTLIILPEYKGAVYGSGKLTGDELHQAQPVLSRFKNSSQQLAQQYPRENSSQPCWRRRCRHVDDRDLAETNATNLFLVRDGVLCTPFGHACLESLGRTPLIWPNPLAFQSEKEISL